MVFGAASNSGMLLLCTAFYSHYSNKYLPFLFLPAFQDFSPPTAVHIRWSHIPDSPVGAPLVAELGEFHDGSPRSSELHFGMSLRFGNDVSVDVEERPKTRMAQ
jgi:hypothetical protein